MKEYKFPERLHIYIAITVALNCLAIIFAGNSINKAHDRIDDLTVRLFGVMQKVDALGKAK
ncbi:MAG: hypothetical protein V4490_00075 [Pseudomonadota bacterium]